jgi:plasmid maintenance system killer protein
LVEELLDAPEHDKDAIKAAMERLRVAIAKRDHTFKLKSEGRLGRAAATKPLLVLQLVSALGTEREFQFTPRKSQWKSQCKNDILAVLFNEKSVKKFNENSQRWMTAWVEAAEASTENSLTFMAVDSRKAEKLRADNEDFVWKLSIHSTEDTIPPEAVPVETKDRAVDKAFRVRVMESKKPLALPPGE